MVTWAEVEKHETYRASTPERQGIVKQDFFDNKIATHHKFQGYTPDQQEIIRKDFLGVPEHVTAKEAVLTVPRALHRGALSSKKLFGKFLEQKGAALEERVVPENLEDDKAQSPRDRMFNASLRSTGKPKSFISLSPEFKGTLSDELSGRGEVMGYEAEEAIKKLPKKPEMLEGRGLFDVYGDKEANILDKATATVGTVTEATPPIFASLGLSATGLATGNPLLAGAGIAMGTGLMDSQVKGGLYDDILTQDPSLNHKEVADTVNLYGTAITAFELVPMGRILTKTPLLKKLLTKELAKGLAKKEVTKFIATQGAVGFTTEYAQAIIANAGKKVYNENQSYFEGATEEAFVGGLLEAFMGAGASVYASHGSNTNPDAPSIDPNAPPSEPNAPQIPPDAPPSEDRPKLTNDNVDQFVANIAELPPEEVQSTLDLIMDSELSDQEKLVIAESGVYEDHGLTPPLMAKAHVEEVFNNIAPLSPEESLAQEQEAMAEPIAQEQESDPVILAQANANLHNSVMNKLNQRNPDFTPEERAYFDEYNSAQEREESKQEQAKKEQAELEKKADAVREREGIVAEEQELVDQYEPELPSPRSPYDPAVAEDIKTQRSADNLLEMPERGLEPVGEVDPLRNLSPEGEIAQQEYAKADEQLDPETTALAIKQAEDIASENPVYKAVSEARNGGMINLESLSEDFDKEGLANKYPFMFSNTGKLNIDEFANEQGYKDGNALIEDLKSAKPMKDEVKGIAESSIADRIAQADDKVSSMLDIVESTNDTKSLSGLSAEFNKHPEARMKGARRRINRAIRDKRAELKKQTETEVTSEEKVQQEGVVEDGRGEVNGEQETQAQENKESAEGQESGKKLKDKIISITNARAKFEQEVRDANQSAQAMQVFWEKQSDPVLGMFGVNRFHEVNQAITELEANKIPYVYERADGGNLGGLNNIMSHNKADDQMRKVWGEIYVRGVNSNGGMIAREQGDEFIAIYPNKTKAEAVKIREGIEAEMRKKIVALGFDKVPHSKQGGLETGALHTYYGIVDPVDFRADGKLNLKEMDGVADEAQEIMKAEQQATLAEEQGYHIPEGGESYVKQELQHQERAGQERRSGETDGTYSQELRKPRKQKERRAGSEEVTAESLVADLNTVDEKIIQIFGTPESLDKQESGETPETQMLELANEYQEDLRTAIYEKDIDTVRSILQAVQDGKLPDQSTSGQAEAGNVQQKADILSEKESKKYKGFSVTGEDGRAYILEDLASAVYKAGMKFTEFARAIRKKLGKAYGQVRGKLQGVFDTLSKPLRNEIGAIGKIEARADRGTFSKTDPDIMFSKSDEGTPKEQQTINNTTKLNATIGGVTSAPKISKSELDNLLFKHPAKKKTPQQRKEIASLKGNVTRSVKDFAHDFALEADRYLGSISTRLGNIDQALKEKLRTLEFYLGVRAMEDVKEVKALLEKAKTKMTKDEFMEWDFARKNSNLTKINELVEKYGMQGEYKAYRAKLDSIRKEAEGVGLDVGFIDEYAPRILKDAKGFLRAIGRDGDTGWSAIREAWKRVADNRGENVGQLSEEMKADIASNVLFSGQRGTGSPTGVKTRKIKKIPAHLNRYYMDSDSALLSYLQSMRKTIEQRKFFGKVPKTVSEAKKRVNALKLALKKESAKADTPQYEIDKLEANVAKAENDLESAKNALELDPTTMGEVAEARKALIGAKAILRHSAPNPDKIAKIKENMKFHQELLNKYKASQGDYSENISQFVTELLMDGKITQPQEQILTDILTARFNERGAMGMYQAYKNFSYIDTMGNSISALTQLGDLPFAMYVGGLGRGLANIPKAVVNKTRIAKEDVGVERMAQEFADSDTLSKAVTKVFKVVGLEKMDAIGKNTLLETALETFEEQAQKDPKALAKEIKPIFGNETGDVIADLQEGEITENVKRLVYGKLLDFQPAALSEMSEKYLLAGNGRLFWMLKTFTLNQFDIFRREVYNDLKNGNKEEKKQALKNLTRLSMMLVIANAGADSIKNLVLNRDFDLSDMVVDNILKLFGISKYVTWKARTEGVGSAAMKQILPPFKFVDSLTKDITSAGDEKGLYSLSSVPVVGKLAYWHMGRGKKSRLYLWEKRLSKKRKKLKQIEDKIDADPSVKAKYGDEIRSIKRIRSFDKRLRRQRRKLNQLIARDKKGQDFGDRIKELELKRTETIKEFLDTI